MDEQEKQRIMIAAIGFGMTVIIYQILFNSGLVFGEPAFVKFFIALGLGAVVGGAVYGVMKAINK